jgi:indolepyruvate decarboxylase
MTVQSLSTMARANLNAIVVIVDNDLYGYEQYLLDPTYYSGTSWAQRQQHNQRPRGR